MLAHVCSVCPAVLGQLHMTTRLFTHMASHHEGLITRVIECSDCSEVDAAVKSVAHAVAVFAAECVGGGYSE
jgi:hypothetical protein